MSDVYGAVIAEHFRRPHNLGSLESPDAVHEELNPLCGDRIRIELKLDVGRVVAARFRGDACMVAVAATSLLTGMVVGLSLDEAAQFPEERLLAALETTLRPLRMQCARLPLQALRGALDGAIDR
jgi:nitrogen fixation NifU-like protein